MKSAAAWRYLTPQSRQLAGWLGSLKLKVKPTKHHRIVHRPYTALLALFCILHGGARCTPTEYAAIIQFGATYRRAYCSTGTPRISRALKRAGDELRE